MGDKKKKRSPKVEKSQEVAYDHARFASSAVSSALSEMTKANVSITEDKMTQIQSMKKKMRQVKDASKEAQRALERGFKKDKSLQAYRKSF